MLYLRRMFNRHQRVAQQAFRSYLSTLAPPFSITGINEWHFISSGYWEIWLTAIQYHRHQRVAPLKPVYRARNNFQPPFSITGINEWHTRRACKSQRVSAAIQYHRHQRVARGHRCSSACTWFSAIQYHRHQRVAPELPRVVFPRPAPAIQYHRHQRVALGISIQIPPCHFPPFSITGINEWHLHQSLFGKIPHLRHSVSQASTSGTAGHRLG